jgi:hypothetical protein
MRRGNEERQSQEPITRVCIVGAYLGHCSKRVNVCKRGEKERRGWHKRAHPRDLLG